MSPVSSVPLEFLHIIQMLLLNMNYKSTQQMPMPSSEISLSLSLSLSLSFFLSRILYISHCKAQALNPLRNGCIIMGPIIMSMWSAFVLPVYNKLYSIGLRFARNMKNEFIEFITFSIFSRILPLFSNIFLCPLSGLSWKTD